MGGASKSIKLSCAWEHCPSSHSDKCVAYINKASPVDLKLWNGAYMTKTNSFNEETKEHLKVCHANVSSQFNFGLWTINDENITTCYRTANHSMPNCN